MANIMNLTKVSNKPTRNGYDLSQKINFTAKVGELMPVWWTPVLPTDSLTAQLNNFIRTQSLNQAAFARMRGYYDFYFVPFSQLWNKFNTAITQMTTNLQVASGPVMSDNKALTGQLPYFTCEQVANYIVSLGQKKNTFGFFRSTMTCRLLEYLGYGDFYAYDPNGATKTTWTKSPMKYNLALSPFPLLAYQKIYADYNRYTQWEKSNPSTFNLDYITGNGDLNLDLTVEGLLDSFNLFDVRYSNWQKDLFHGVLPVAQYGEASVVSVNAGSMPVVPAPAGSTNNDRVAFTWAGGDSGFVPPAASAASEVPLELDKFSDNLYILNGKYKTDPPSATWNLKFAQSGLVGVGDQSTFALSILALRRAEAAQKWKEVALAAEEDYTSQIGAHWGQRPSDLLSGMCRYLGGVSCNLDINPITNTNLADDNAALQRATGTMSAKGGIHYNANGQYGIVMCIFRALPLIDYTSTGVHFGCTLTDVTDFPIPEFDRIGMESVPVCRAMNPIASEAQNIPDFLGYAPRYIDWKTSIDVSRGEFSSTLESFVLPFNDASFFAANDADFPNNPNVESGSIKAGFFKVNPHSVDTLFAVNADKADQLLCSTFFDVKVVRSLDANGLPY